MKRFLFFVATVLLFVSCDGYDDGNLPPETQEGKGTLGFTVNGNAFKGRNFSMKDPMWYNSYQKTFSLWRSGGVDGFPIDLTIHVLANEVTEEGKTFKLSQREFRNDEDKVVRLGDFGEILYEYHSENPKIWDSGASTSEIHTGELTITKLDTVKKIISGRFWFDVETEAFGVLKVRDGRFDYNYSKQQQ